MQQIRVLVVIGSWWYVVRRDFGDEAACRSSSSHQPQFLYIDASQAIIVNMKGSSTLSILFSVSKISLNNISVPFHLADASEDSVLSEIDDEVL
jgi:hypothetical protein